MQELLNLIEQFGPVAGLLIYSIWKEQRRKQDDGSQTVAWLQLLNERLERLEKLLEDKGVTDATKGGESPP